MAIKRLSGRYSTLVANPRKRGATRTAAQKKAAEQIKKLEQKLADTRKKAREAAAAAAEKLAESQRKAREKAEAKGRRVGRSRAAASRRSAAATRKAQRERLGYSVKAIPADASLVGYAYPMRKPHTSKSGKTTNRLVGYATRGSLMKGRKPPFAIIKQGGQVKLHKNPRRRRKYARRNAGLVIAGVPVVEMAIGSAATIAVGAVSEALIKKYAGDKVPAFLQGIVGEIATAGIAAFAHGKLKNPMHREIAKYAFIGAVFQIISEKASPMIVDGINKALPADAQATSKSTEATDSKNGAGGGYMPLNGLYLSADSGDFGVGGAYMQTNGSHSADLGGLGLFQGKSIYG